MRADINPDVLLLEVFQLRDELSGLGDVVATKRLTTILRDALPAEKYLTIKVQAIRVLGLSIEDIETVMKTVVINHAERSSVPNRSQKSYRKDRDSGLELTMRDRGRKSVITFTRHTCKKPGHRMKYCKQLKKSDMSSNLKSSKNIWCTYHRSNGYLNENCYQQQLKPKSGNFDNRERWCNYPNSGSHSDDEYSHQKIYDERKESPPADGNSKKDETFIADSAVNVCDKVEKKTTESNAEPYTPPGIGFSFAACYISLSQQADGFQLLIDSGSSKHFIDPELIRGVESRMLEYTKREPSMKIRATRDNILHGTAQGILLLVVVCGTDKILDKRPTINSSSA